MKAMSRRYGCSLNFNPKRELLLIIIIIIIIVVYDCCGFVSQLQAALAVN